MACGGVISLTVRPDDVEWSVLVRCIPLLRVIISKWVATSYVSCYLPAWSHSHKSVCRQITVFNVGQIDLLRGIQNTSDGAGSLSAERVDVGRVHAVRHAWAGRSRDLESPVLRLYLVVDSIEGAFCGRLNRDAVVLLRLARCGVTRRHLDGVCMTDYS